MNEGRATMQPRIQPASFNTRFVALIGALSLASLYGASVGLRSALFISEAMTSDAPMPPNEIITRKNDETVGDSQTESDQGVDANEFSNTQHASDHDVPPFDSANLPHPHAGSRCPNGTMGYIADPTALRRNLQSFLQQLFPDELDPLSNASHYWDLLTDYYPQHRNGSLYGNHRLGSPYVCNLGPGRSFEDDGGYKLLTEKITVSSTATAPTTPTPPIKVLCSIYTYRKMRDLSRAHALSWGHKCDGYLAFSTETIPELGMLEILHAGEEMYDNMWQKVRSIWAYIHDQYLNDYDFFHLGGDDLYLIVENLKRFLGRLHVSTPASTLLFLGQIIDRPNQAPFVAGAPGYTMNRAALRAFVAQALPTCHPDTRISAEDRIISKCFRTVLNITPGDTRDIVTGEQQYHDCDPHHLYTFRASQGKASFHAKAAAAWETMPHPSLPGTVGPKHGLEGAAQYSATLHDVYHPVFCARIHALLYKDTCPETSSLGRALRAHGFL
jgi:hypothetical protein